jgi:hypothetical protein
LLSSILLTPIVTPAIYAVVKGTAIRSPRLAQSLQQRELRLRCRQTGSSR